MLRIIIGTVAIYATGYIDASSTLHIECLIPLGSFLAIPILLLYRHHCPKQVWKLRFLKVRGLGDTAKSHSFLSIRESWGLNRENRAVNILLPQVMNCK